MKLISHSDYFFLSWHASSSAYFILKSVITTGGFYKGADIDIRQKWYVFLWLYVV